MIGCSNFILSQNAISEQKLLIPARSPSIRISIYNQTMNVWFDSSFLSICESLPATALM